MNLRPTSRRRFLKASTAALATTSLNSLLHAETHRSNQPLIAYVGTFSSPLSDVLPTQVGLPPGNGRGIHRFEVDRKTGAMKLLGVQRMGTSPSCLAVNAKQTRLYSTNETDRVGVGKEGSVTAFAIDSTHGKLEPLNTVASGGAGPTKFTGNYAAVGNPSHIVFVDFSR